MESVSEKTECNTSEDKFNSKVLNEKLTTDESEKAAADINEHINDVPLEAMAELDNRTIVIKENGREEKRPKLENLPDTEDQETVDINSVSEGKENNIMIILETGIEQNLKPEEERDQEKQQIFENKIIKSEEIKDTAIQTIELVSQETGEKEADIQTVENEVALTKEDTQEKLGKDDNTPEDVISDTSDVIETNEAGDVAQKAIENNLEDAQSNDRNEVVEVDQKLVSKPTEGPEAGSSEEVPVKDVETKEIGQKSVEDKDEEQLISLENIVKTNEESGTNEDEEITESSSTEEIEVRHAVIYTDQEALGNETPDAHEATAQIDTEQKPIPCEVPIKREPHVTSSSQPSEPQPVLIPSININSEDAENKGEIGALSKTETMLLPESENQKENDTDSGTGSTADNSSIDLNLSISSFLSKTKDSGSISLQVSICGSFFVTLQIYSLCEICFENKTALNQCSTNPIKFLRPMKQSTKKNQGEIFSM